jgi:hypothetical protein
VSLQEYHLLRAPTRPPSPSPPTSQIKHLHDTLIVIHQSFTLYDVVTRLKALHSFGYLHSEAFVTRKLQQLSLRAPLPIPTFHQIEKRVYAVSRLLPYSPRLLHLPTRSPWALRSTMPTSTPQLQRDCHPSTWMTDLPSHPSNLYRVPPPDFRQPRHAQYRQAITIHPHHSRAVCSFLHCRHWHR